MYVRPTAVFTSSTMLWKLPETSFCADQPVEEDTVFDLHPLLWSCFMM